ncbi:hypothetical protein PIB30_035450 [Stylosanthes scabra]|uniref:Uncharacterized protein n=1 Tax=Stylosanthes scabra TaxID=79078 RepID=A0ABU6UCJ5_9FABA|nr:hypothetical protein [Stylosanthes scabra]
MAHNGPSPLAKGKCKPETLVTLAITAPALSLPPKKRPIPKGADEGTSKAAARSFCKRSQRITAIDRTFNQAPTEQEVIAISSDCEPKPTLKETSNGILENNDDMEEDPDEDPQEAPQNDEVEDEEEDPEEEQEEAAGGGGAKGMSLKEDDFADF